MRILHTSDWHLGRSLHGYSLIEDQAYALERLLEAIQEEQVDLLIIAGDIYDKSIPNEAAVELFNQFINKISLEHQISTVMISGNHDSSERVDFGSKLFASQKLYIAGKAPCGYQKVSLTCKGECVDIFMIPYIEPAHVREIAHDDSIKRHDEAMAYLVSQIKKEQTENPTLIVAHAFVAGGDVSDSERRLSVVGGAELVNAVHFKGFTYTALGHLHKRQAMGADNIRYSGSLLKYSVSEANQNKGYVLLEIQEGKLVSIEEKPLKVLRNVRVLTGSLDELITYGSGDLHRQDYVFARLTGTVVDDVTAKLRHVYPNILGSEWVKEDSKGQVDEGAEQADFIETKEKSVTEVFLEFLDFIGENDFDQEEIGYIKEMVQTIEEGKYEA